MLVRYHPPPINSPCVTTWRLYFRASLIVRSDASQTSLLLRGSPSGHRLNRPVYDARSDLATTILSTSKTPDRRRPWTAR